MPVRRKVAILAEPLDQQSAGIYVYLKRLVKGLSELDQKDTDYHLIRAEQSSEDFGLKNILIQAKSYPGYPLFRKLFIIPFYLRKNNYDMVIEPAHFGPFNLPSRMKRITIIHDLTPILMPQFHPMYSSILHSIFLPLIFRKSDKIICNSIHTRSDITMKYSFASNKTRFIYPSINPIFKPSYNRDKLDFLGIKERYLLSVGTIEPRKNYLTLVRAFELFCESKNDPELQLVIVGRKGWKSGKFYRYVNKSPFRDRIKVLHDLQTDVLPYLYTHCKLFIFPSLYEGYGFPLIEAYNCGAECLAAYNSSLKEIGQDFANYFKADDPDALKDLIIRKLQESGKKPARDAGNIYNEEFAETFHNEVQDIFDPQL